MFLELIIDAVIPVKVPSLPWKNVDVNMLHSLSSFGAILHGKGEGCALEVLLHHCPDSLGHLKQIGHFIRSQVSEALHWPKGTHQDMSWDHRFPVHQGKGQFCFEKHHRGLDEMLAESECHFLTVKVSLNLQEVFTAGRAVLLLRVSAGRKSWNTQWKNFGFPRRWADCG